MEKFRPQMKRSRTARDVRDRLMKNIFGSFLAALFLFSCHHPSEKLEICFTGDLLLDRGVREQIDRKGADALFESISPEFKSADFSIANLECPVTKVESPVYKRFVFRGEPEWLPALKKAGLTHLCMANNHTYDQGRAGITGTYKNLLKNDLVPLGYGADQKQASLPVIIEKNDLRVAIFSSVLVRLENWEYFADSVGVCQLSAGELSEEIKKYHNTYPGDKIVVILHWGVEYQPEPDKDQRTSARQFIDAGADAVVGHHPHVIQSHEYYKGKPIYYSLGNFVFDPTREEAKKGMLLKLIFSGSEVKDSYKIFEIKNCAPVLTGE
jgi:poly-gamma-glutamate synthesis protein (capsule biosynthesis protein)